MDIIEPVLDTMDPVTRSVSTLYGGVLEKEVVEPRSLIIYPFFAVLQPLIISRTRPLCESNEGRGKKIYYFWNSIFLVQF